MDREVYQDAVGSQLRTASVRAKWLRRIAFVLFLVFIFSLAEMDGKPLCPAYVPWLVLPWVVLFAFSAYRTWRCPVCRQPLRGTVDPKFCPECGVRYDELDDAENAGGAEDDPAER